MGRAAGRTVEPLLHEAAEVVPAGGVAPVGVPVEAGASRREQDDVPGAGRSARLLDGLGHRRRRGDRDPAGEGGGDGGRRLADRHHGPDAPRVGGHRREVQSLVQPAGDQDDVVEGADRGRGGVGGRRLGVVEPAHAAGVADELDAMRWTGERRHRRRHRVRSDEAGLEDERGGGEPVGEIVGQGAGQAGDVGEGSGRDRRGVRRSRSLRRGSRRRPARTCAAGPGAARRWAITTGSAAYPIATSVGRCWLKMRALAAS